MFTSRAQTIHSARRPPLLERQDLGDHRGVDGMSGAGHAGEEIQEAKAAVDEVQASGKHHQVQNEYHRESENIIGLEEISLAAAQGLGAEDQMQCHGKAKQKDKDDVHLPGGVDQSNQGIQQKQEQGVDGQHERRDFDQRCYELEDPGHDLLAALVDIGRFKDEQIYPQKCRSPVPEIQPDHLIKVIGLFEE